MIWTLWDPCGTRRVDHIQLCFGSLDTLLIAINCFPLFVAAVVNLGIETNKKSIKQKQKINLIKLVVLESSRMFCRLLVHYIENRPPWLGIDFNIDITLSVDSIFDGQDHSHLTGGNRIVQLPEICYRLAKFHR